MLSVILPNTQEPTVLALTIDNLHKELASVPTKDGKPQTELILANSWVEGLTQISRESDYVCLVEPDCLVSSSYFASNLSLFRKNEFYRKLAMMSSCLGVETWNNRVYGYGLEKITRSLGYIKGKRASSTTTEVRPKREKKVNGLYEVQIGFVPGAILRRTVFDDKTVKYLRNPNLVEMSTKLSFHLWNTGRRILINPNTTYVSTDRSLEEPAFRPITPSVVANIFEKEGI